MTSTTVVYLYKMQLECQDQTINGGPIVSLETGVAEGVGTSGEICPSFDGWINT